MSMDDNLKVSEALNNLTHCLAKSTFNNRYNKDVLILVYNALTPPKMKKHNLKKEQIVDSLYTFVSN